MFLFNPHSFPKEKTKDVSHYFALFFFFVFFTRRIYSLEIDSVSKFKVSLRPEEITEFRFKFSNSNKLIKK